MTDFLFALPSFLAGFGSAIDFGGTMMNFNYSDSQNEADSLALSNDWAMVGNDIRNAMRQYEDEQSEKY